MPEVTVTSLVGVVTGTDYISSHFKLYLNLHVFFFYTSFTTITKAQKQQCWQSHVYSGFPPTAPYQFFCQSTALVSSEWVPRPSCLLFWVAHKSKNPHSCLWHHLDLMMPSSNHLLKYKMTKTRRSSLMTALETVTFPYRLHFYSTWVKSGETVE